MAHQSLFGPFRVSESVAMALYTGAGALGLAVFVAIGVSRHPEVRTVRVSGTAVGGVFVACVLYACLARHH